MRTGARPEINSADVFTVLQMQHLGQTRRTRRAYCRVSCNGKRWTRARSTYLSVALRSGQLEYRIFYGPDAATQDRPWILVIREAGEDGVYDAHIHHSIHGTPDEAKLAADQWEGPPPRG